ncbi:serine-rich adhesin for platelets [Anopheles bellator]|uniref:serine-rich adhesin for platelets n=1 Tax=Anopheles bellator TaxID=139047 RepID=UPI00264971D1|nr:serine-rich adhesin for platelets [Anopheles bellator]
MNFRYRATFCIVFLLCASITFGEDFDFIPETTNDDVKPLAPEPMKIVSNTKIIYHKTLPHGLICPPTAKTVRLSLILLSENWKHITAHLKQRTITTLSEYFLVPEELFTVQSIKDSDLCHMMETASQHGKSISPTGKTFELIGFTIGCDDGMSKYSKQMFGNVESQMEDIKAFTELDFVSWIIWKESKSSQLMKRRPKREVDEDDYNYDYDDENDDDDEGETTEVPHAHRHHHGSSEQQSQHSSNSGQIVTTHATNKYTDSIGQKHSSTSIKSIAGGLEKRKPLMVPVQAQTASPKHKSNHGLYDQIKARSAKRILVSDTAAQTGNSNQSKHYTPLPDLAESVSQLESTITKTIRNNEQLKREEERLLTRKSKHKLINIERIIETELLLPEIERLQEDTLFRDDYVTASELAVELATEKNTLPVVTDKIIEFAQPSTTTQETSTITLPRNAKHVTKDATTLLSSIVTPSQFNNVDSMIPLTKRPATVPNAIKALPKFSEIGVTNTTIHPTITSTLIATNSPINIVHMVRNTSDQPTSPSKPRVRQTHITTIDTTTAATPQVGTDSTSSQTDNLTKPSVSTIETTTNQSTAATATTLSTASSISTTVISTAGTASSEISSPPSTSATNIRSTQTVAFVPLVKKDESTTASSSKDKDLIRHTATTFPSSIGTSPPISSSSTSSTTSSFPLSSRMEDEKDSDDVAQAIATSSTNVYSSFSTDILDRDSTILDSFESDIKRIAGNGERTQPTPPSTTTYSNAPLTTASNWEPRAFVPQDNHPFGRLLNGDDASEEEDEQREDETSEDVEEYYSPGVRITVLPNLPSHFPGHGDTVTMTTTFTPPRSSNSEFVDTTHQAFGTPTTDTPGMAFPTLPTVDSTTTTTIASSPDTTTLTIANPTTITTTTATNTTTITTTIDSATSSATTASNPSASLAPEPDTVAPSTTLELQTTTTQRSTVPFTTPKQEGTATVKQVEYENYDDEYDDEEEGVEAEPTTVSTIPDPRSVASTTEKTLPQSTKASTTTSSSTPETTFTTPTTTTTTTAATTTTKAKSSTVTTTTTEAPTTTTTVLTTELDEPTNLSPIIKNRIPKQAIIAGKVFNYQIPLETFYDNEDGNNLRLELLDGREQPLKHYSWIQFNVDTKEIYGLPLEKDVSKWPYKLRATDSGNQTVAETVDIMVQQHKSHRSVNHEISLALKLNRKFTSNVDWQIETIRGIATVLGDASLGNVVVRDIRNSLQDPNVATFVYTNETLPKDRCPEEKLDELLVRLTEQALNDALRPDITVKSVQGQQIGQCTKPTLPKVKPTLSISRNFAPQARNQVDQVNATVGHLLVFKVPADTFYDPEDGNELKLKLLTTERNTLDPYHWLQFDNKNQEFYGVPRSNDIGRKEYLLMAEDREGLTATDALVVVVNPHHKRDYSVLFELTLDTTHEQFSTAQAQRRFIERLALVFGDPSTNYIKIHHIRPIHHTGQVQVSFFNTTLNRQHQRCPQEEIEALRNILLHQDSTIRAKVRETLTQEFSLQNVSLVPLDNCHGFDTPHHPTSEPEKAAPPPISKDDYLLTFVLPTVIILIMLMIAFIIACVLYKRRLTGKMELEYINFKPIAPSSCSPQPQGTDEERKSFRSKGIPVIFQDELDEKPEIGNKSPVILKDEKPPLLPPSYSSTNNDGENEDVDEYVPPPAVIVAGRESRGKSPVTPSYRRPPPYVSP